MKIRIILLLISSINFLQFISPCSAQTIYSRSYETFNDIFNSASLRQTKNRPKIGLVLSGGGARGIAHVGVIKALEKYNIPIDLIVGSSIGSVIGGYYAAGYSSQQLEQIVRKIEWDSLFSDNTERENLFLAQKFENDRYLLNIRFEGFKAYIPSSLTPGQRILNELSDRLLHVNFQAAYNFDNLPIRFRAVATDLISGQRLVISKGDLAEAINASSAVPLLFSPVEWDNMLLVDGGIRTNLPVDVALDLGMDVVIAVDITSPLRNRDELRAPWEIADQVTTIMMSLSRKEQIKLADIVISPALEGLGNADFANKDTLIFEGEKAVDKVISQIQDLLNCYAETQPDTLLSVNKISYELSQVPDEFANFKSILPNQTGKLLISKIRSDADSLFHTGIFSKIKAEIRIQNTDTTLLFLLSGTDTINAVHFTGNTIFPDSVLSQQLKHKLHRAINYNILRLDLQSIRKYYLNRGYALAAFDTVLWDSTEGLLTINISEGIIRQIKTEGNKNTNRFVIMREIPLEEGSVLNSGDIRKGIANIYNTQLFDKVSVGLDQQNGHNDLIIKVLEKKTKVLKLGGKIGSERGAESYLELADENLFGNSDKLILLGRYGAHDRKVSLNFRADRVFKSYLTLELNSYYQWTLNPYYVANKKSGEYREERQGVKLIFGQQLKKLGQVSVEFRIEHVADTRTSGDVPEFNKSELRTITLRSVTDKRDKIGFTNNGIYNVWYWESGNQQILQGQEKYTKALVNLEGYYTFWPGNNFHLKGMIGVADRTLPFSEYFRIGGLDSFIGLHDFELFGRQLILANIEYRYKFPFKIITDAYLGFRYDSGGIWESPNLLLEGEDIIHGYGGWLGFDTILGPLILGYGDTSEKNGLFYISLGYNF